MGFISRRERHKQATRERIVDCAAQLFAASGYDATAIDDITSCAEVARATVFNYLARKEEIILERFADGRKGPRPHPYVTPCRQRPTWRSPE